MIVVPSNLGPPSRITIRIVDAVLGPDLTTVAAVNLLVRRSDGSTATWACSIESATSRELVAQYAIQAGDITATGAYELAPQLTIQGGVLPCFTVDMFVSSPFNCRPKYDDATSVATTTAISPDSRAVRTTWKHVTPAASPFAANPLQPWLALDLSTGPVTVQLWPALDGDIVALTDYLGGAATNNATIVAAAGQSVPTSIGHYANAVVLSASGFLVRLKFFAETQFWLPSW